MSSAITGTKHVAVDLPEYDEASGVTVKIESQVGNIKSLFASIDAILREMQSLQPPDPANYPADKTGVNAARYKADCETYIARVNALNQQLDAIQSKLGEALAVLNRLQSSDLPAAQRNDAENIRKSVEEAQKALEDAAKSVEDQRKAGEGSSGGDEPRVSVRVVEKKMEIKLKDDPSFRDVIHAFALMAQMVGGGAEVAKATKTVRMPSGLPGGGLPPINMP